MKCCTRDNRPSRHASWGICAIALFAAAIFLSATPPAIAESRVALVIGNGTYGNEIGSLTNPPNDANLMAEHLTALGFKVTKLVNGDQKAMKRAISAFGQQLNAAGPDSVGLFFYAGHGVQVDGANYLIPVNAAIKAEADVDLEAVSAEAVLKQMEYAGTRVNIVILDACRNNPLPRSMRSSSRGLARMDAPTGSFIGYSTAPGNVAADGGGKNSPYTAALVTEMAKPGIAIEEAFRNVRVKVMANTGSEQVPWESSSLTGAFFFQPDGSFKTAVAPAAKTPEASQTEQIFWQSIKDSKDPSEFDAYLTRFPEGAFAELARVKLARLRTTPPKVAERSPEIQQSTKTAASETTIAAPASQATNPAVVPAPVVASVTPPSTGSPNGTIQLSAKVGGMLKTYLSQLLNRNGAFAVSPDGMVAASFICDDLFLCVPGKRTSPQNQDRQLPQKRALQKCNSLAKLSCVVLMVRDSEKRAYSVSDP